MDLIFQRSRGYIRIKRNRTERELWLRISFAKGWRFVVRLDEDPSRLSPKAMATTHEVNMKPKMLFVWLLSTSTCMKACSIDLRIP
jgi:hypothetical protein